jgi:hypothetical protein
VAPRIFVGDEAIRTVRAWRVLIAGVPAQKTKPRKPSLIFSTNNRAPPVLTIGVCFEAMPVFSDARMA